MRKFCGGSFGSPLFFLLMLPAFFSSGETSDLYIAKDGRPAAAVITADAPSPVALYAARELVSHLEKATGAVFPILSEGEENIPGHMARIYVGETESAGEHGINTEHLAPDAFILRTAGDNIFVLGKEDMDADPLSSATTASGTLFGVYELLEKCVGVRWVWPGELGTYIPSLENIRISPTEQETAPRLNFREIAWSRIRRTAVNKTSEYPPEMERLGFTREGLESYGADLQVYLRRHRMGRSHPKPRTTHYFSGWWEHFGEEHPEWFMLNEEGERGPVTGRGPRHVPMCVANPDFHRFLARHWDGESTITLGEVDHKDACRCPKCLSWDPPKTVEWPDFAEGFADPMVVSDRYARFWKTVQRKAQAKAPDPLVTTYLYYNYFPAPVTGIKLNENIYGEFVQWGNPRHTDFFPMSAEAFEWLKQQWIGWRDTGIRIAYRPNYLHDGWVMPHVNLRQAAEFFKFAVEHGMEGSRFDSLTGQWAAQGPKLYLHMRLHAKPELDIEQVLDEYYEVFGPASEYVRAYFDYWENYAIENMQYINDLYIDVGHRWQRFPLKAHLAFPPESYKPAEEILRKALKAAARSNPDYARRVKFLKAGLEHAKLAGELAALFDGERTIPQQDPRHKEARDKLQELVGFRKEHEHLYISDYEAAGWRERRWLNIDRLF